MDEQSWIPASEAVDFEIDEKIVSTEQLPKSEGESRLENIEAYVAEQIREPAWYTVLKPLSEQDLTGDDFAITLSQRVMLGRFQTAEDFENNIGWLWNAGGGMTQPLTKRELFETFKEFEQTSLPIDLVRDAMHTTSLSNAFADIEAGAFRPASSFNATNRKNTIGHSMENPHWVSSDDGTPITADYEFYKGMSHEDYVFFTSTSNRGSYTSYRQYALKQTPVTFITDKAALAHLGLEQIAGVDQLEGEVRIGGAVPVAITKVIFTDTDALSPAELETLQIIAPVFDQRYLDMQAFSMQQAFNIWYAADKGSYYQSLLPKGEFEIEGYLDNDNAIADYLAKVTRD